MKQLFTIYFLAAFCSIIISYPGLSMAQVESSNEDKSNVALLRMELPRDFSTNEQFTLTNDFLSALYNTGKFSIIDRKEMDPIIKELKFQASDFVDPDEVVELGSMLGADLFVTLSIKPSRGNYQITSQLISVEKANIEKMVVKKCDDKFDFISSLFNEIAYDLAGLEEKKGRLHIETDPPKAKVYLCGISQGKSPLTIKIAPGNYLVKIKKSKYKEKRKYIDIEANEETSWKAELIKKKRTRLGDYIGGKSFWSKERKGDER